MADDTVEEYDEFITTALKGSETTKEYPVAPVSRFHEMVMVVLEKFKGSGKEAAMTET